MAAHRHIPLIRFLGSRKNITHTPNASTISSNPVLPTVSMNKTGRVISYEWLSQLPGRYQPLPFSDAELQAIDAGGAGYHIRHV
ncbi:hypothetical protein BATDEDRAFT_85277 [Batrachochytrium dendrobatidis JAM81]|uniref:Uncharacterized protein n=1 Tax=Batrachochytrium dendrobatidis (strain JAM81 / FGSC 10211) TaxID=684364 RepID=F4NTY1_BATDJ|nr:uncharacterized protein BATDEDRAFT_85277 [Batrachochytrium dendrobatidis JAM81]EGF84372.1 hypothetical protein BATDEDRAFT_85277 [Batrachochytrium dendrobatidis JAM81]KAJ8327235.1 hypothetical protein O5D80_004642 [Batrachochytrium dendrobatidis]KAK5667863.1 hypothetical protein QVD99_004912 [Batrachochytrium dendrobatidis]|eukprot:XP_006676420.1 hypothetical protein BATDEDRAFT_85277 [Batrachochytrium dendrobatidis JAM81]